MSPSLRPGQIVIAITYRRRLAINDVIIFQHNGLEKIKRVTRLGQEGVFVVGDNASASTDSREFGAVPYSAVVGVAVWPKIPSTTAQPSNITE